MSAENRLGKIFTTKEGYEATILEYFSYKNVTVQFNHNKEIVVKNINFRYVENGGVRNPLHPSVHSIGYIGIGKYKPVVNNYPIRAYILWKAMLSRCYYRVLENSTYKKAVVCEEWHNFQNFAIWVDEYYKEGFHLDKDILFKGNKIYSPETCCFVPQQINSIFVKNNSKRGDVPIGVCFNKKLKKYSASISKNNERVNIGLFNTPEEAFQAYRVAKEEHIKEVANEWKPQLTPETYQALYNYQVETTD